MKYLLLNQSREFHLIAKANGPILCFCIALQTAAYLGHVRIVELLLKVDDQDPNIVDHHREHALGSAARSTSPRRDCCCKAAIESS